MPKINKTQETALEVVDFLYFYDLATLASFTEEKKEVYGQINNVIDTIFLIKKFFDEKAEIYRHFLLCGVEVVATRSIDFTSLEIDGEITEFIPPSLSKEVNKKRHDIAFKAVYEAVCESGYDGVSFIKDVFCVVESTGIRERSHDVCFRLVFQVLWSDTDIVRTPKNQYNTDMSYPIHFRKKILAKLEEGQSIRAVAQHFEINKNTIVEWKKRIEIKRTRPRKPSKVDDDALRADVEQYPDDYQYERAARFGCGISTIGDALKGLNITVKKRPYCTRKQKQNSESSI